MKEGIDLTQNEELISEFGVLLSRQRNVTGKSRKNLAAQLGVSQVALERWESSVNLPDEEKLLKIAEVYGIDLDKLKEKYEISKKAKEVLRTERKPKAVQEKTSDTMFPGQIHQTKEIRRTNPQVFAIRRK